MTERFAFWIMLVILVINEVRHMVSVNAWVKALRETNATWFEYLQKRETEYGEFLKELDRRFGGRDT